MHDIRVATFGTAKASGRQNGRLFWCGNIDDDDVDDDVDDDDAAGGYDVALLLIAGVVLWRVNILYALIELTSSGAESMWFGRESLL